MQFLQQQKKNNTYLSSLKLCISEEQKVIEMQFAIKESKWLIGIYINPLVELIKK